MTIFIKVRKFPAVFLAVVLLIFVAFMGGCGFWGKDPNILSEVRTFAGSKSQLGEPFGIAVKSGEVFVSDGAKGVIWKVSEAGTVEKFADGFATPSHIAFDGNGDLFVADSGNNTIEKVDSAGRVTSVAGVKGKSGLKDGKAAESLFSGPVGIAVEGSKVFVSDTYNDRIRLIENGTVKTLTGSSRGFLDNKEGSVARFDTPCGIVYYNGRLFVADMGNRRIRAVEMDGATATVLGGSGESDDGLLISAGLDMPVDVEFDSGGAMFVADGNRIRAAGRRFVSIVETVAGRNRGFQDGAAKVAMFNRIGSIGFGKDGDLLVADADNSLVRVLTGFSNGAVLSRLDFEKTIETAAGFRKNTPARWPYKDPKKTREIAGTVGEIRGSVKTDSKANAGFHNGLDIVGGYGEEAFAIRDEKVLRPLAVGEFKTQREYIRFPAVGYVHLRLGRDRDGKPFGDRRFRFDFDEAKKVKDLRVPRGTMFKAGDKLGTLNSMNHVHLVTGLAGREYNGLISLNLPGVSDGRPPILQSVSVFDKEWREIEAEDEVFKIKKDSVFRIVAEAFDQMDGNAERRKLGLFRLGYSIQTAEGKPVPGFDKIKWTVVFDGTPDRESAAIAYAKGSSSGATGTTVFRYIVSNKVSGSRAREHEQTASFPKGDYVLIVKGEDYFGNSASKEIRLRIE